MNTENLIKGEITKSGKQTYKFYNNDGKIIDVLVETAEKNKYKPVLKGNHNDENFKKVEISELDLIRQKELERLSKKIDNNVVDKQTEKILELKAKKEKAEKEQQEFDNSIKQKIEKENERKKEVERLQSLRGEVEKQKVISQQNVESNKIIKEETQKIQQIKEEKLEDKIKPKESLIVDKLFSNPIATILKDYINKQQNFEIFHNGNLIYSSNVTEKTKLIMKDDWFELFGKRYPYNGLRFKKLN